MIAPKEEKKKGSKLANLPRREGAIIGDPDELIHMDWSSEWNLFHRPIAAHAIVT